MYNIIVYCHIGGIEQAQHFLLLLEVELQECRTWYRISVLVLEHFHIYYI